jgi:hypothetical protein
MKMTDETSKPSQHREERKKPRSIDLSNPMAEIILSGNPIHQLKIRDISEDGAGIVVRPDSRLMNRIEIGQEVNVKLVSPRDYRGPFGSFRSRVIHVTEIQEGRYKGHLAVGVYFLHSLE